jgi:acetone carboxylase gamma subunit
VNNLTEEQIKRAKESAEERKRKLEKDLSFGISEKHRIKAQRQIEVMDTTIKALDKQEAAQPVTVVHPIKTDYICPECSLILKEVTHGQPMYEYGENGIYCQRCGKKLKWGD